jgi:hypothetical protein
VESKEDWLCEGGRARIERGGGRPGLRLFPTLPLLRLVMSEEVDLQGLLLLAKSFSSCPIQSLFTLQSSTQLPIEETQYVEIVPGPRAFGGTPSHFIFFVGL